MPPTRTTEEEVRRELLELALHNAGRSVWAQAIVVGFIVWLGWRTNELDEAIIAGAIGYLGTAFTGLGLGAFLAASVPVGLGVGIVVGGSLRSIAIDEAPAASRTAAQGVINIGTAIGTLTAAAAVSALADLSGGGAAGSIAGVGSGDAAAGPGAAAGSSGGGATLDPWAAVAAWSCVR